MEMQSRIEFQSTEQNVTHRKKAVAEGENHTTETGEQQSREMVDMTPECTWAVLITHWGRGKAALIDSIVSTKMVFHDQIPDLLLFWELSFFQSGKRPLRTCCYSFRNG